MPEFADSSVRLTPNGASVSVRVRAISRRSASASGCVCADSTPSPPALDTADTSSARDSHRMPLCTTGKRTPSSVVALVLMASGVLEDRREQAAAVVVHHALSLLGRQRLAGLVGEFARRRHALGMRIVRAHDGP